MFSDPRYRTGAVYGLAAATSWASSLASPDGPASVERYWNRYDIAARGDLIKVTLNGVEVSQANVAGAGKNRRGRIAFQFHTGRVQFRRFSILPT